jgi:uncharacterized membrane protein
MMATIRRRRPKVLRILHNHGRLFLAIAIGLIAAVVLPGTWRAVTQALIGWDIGVASYLTLSALMMARCTSDHINRRAEEDDEGAATLMLLTIVAALASIAAVVIELGGAKAAGSRASHFSLAVAALTIVLSWTLIQVMFAFHYARAYYNAPGAGGSGLQFPEDERPDYWDFIYFAFVIGMTFQVSDVQVTSKLLRRYVVTHGFIAFFFNVSILALMVNLAANLL